MPETPESLSTIFAEVRKSLADDSWIDEITALDEDGEPDDFARRVVPLEDALEAIDRIEEAAKRERAAHTNDIHDALYKATGIPGNAAALREALEYVLQFDATDEAAEEDGLTDAERIAEYADHIEECQKKARAALAAPARNCERFATAEEARRAFESAHSHGIVHNLYTAAFDWLFAPAEGGDHA